MSSFIDDTIPPLEVSRKRLMEIVEKLSSLWPTELVCIEKSFGIENYTCRSIVEYSREVRDKFECVDWNGDIEIAGIAMDFLGMAIKNASKYLTIVHISDLDFEMVISNIESRDDVIVL